MGNGALIRTRSLLAEAEGASLSQQIRMGGGKTCPEYSSESGILADRRNSRDRHLRGPYYTPESVTQSPAQYCLFPEPPRQP